MMLGTSRIAAQSVLSLVLLNAAPFEGGLRPAPFTVVLNWPSLLKE
jgi:hypothetical protein